MSKRLSKHVGGVGVGWPWQERRWFSRPPPAAQTPPNGTLEVVPDWFNNMTKRAGRRLFDDETWKTWGKDMIDHYNTTII